MNFIGYPLAISDIRLANGLGLHDGRIEVLVNGVWGTICGLSFSSNEAEAICNILHFKYVIFQQIFFSPDYFFLW